MKHQKLTANNLSAATGAVRPVKLLVLHDVTNGPARIGSRSRHPLLSIATVPGGPAQPRAARRTQA